MAESNWSSKSVSKIVQQGKDRLVVLRSGAQSLHRSWMSEDRTWDLAISSFSSTDKTDYPEAKFFKYFKGGKWDGVYDFFNSNMELLDQYDYVWIPDDDIATSGSDVDKMFDLMELYSLELAQPALSVNSYFWHAITLNCPFTRIRYTNFVEVMVPILTAKTLKAVLPLFENSRSGWGIDNMWARLTTDPKDKCAILDEVTVHHTRPVGSVLAKSMAQDGRSGFTEMDQLDALYAVRSARPLCFRAITKNGQVVRGTWVCGLMQFVGQMPWRSRRRHWWTGPRVFLGSLLSHIRLRPNLSRVDLGAVASESCARSEVERSISHSQLPSKGDGV